MNRDNLKRMADHLDTVEPERFDMAHFNDCSDETFECDSVGCAVGHCSILEKHPKKYICDHGSFKGHFNYIEWSEDFTGIRRNNHLSRHIWSFLFSEFWIDADNTPKGAAARIRYFLSHGLPEDWSEQMFGEAPLCYEKYIKKPSL